MPNEKKGWCSCPEHNSKDFASLTEFYSWNFIPDKWLLEYKTINTINDKRRTLYMTGHCIKCNGFMRSGTSLAVNLSGDKLLEHIYSNWTRYRPYAFNRKDGTYHGLVEARSKWYERLDKASVEVFDEMFLSLFRKKDQSAVKQWLTEVRK